MDIANRELPEMAESLGCPASEVSRPGRKFIWWRIATELQAHFVLRIEAGTWVAVDGVWLKAGQLASPGEQHCFTQVGVTKAPTATQRVNLVTIWAAGETEPWLLISDCADTKVVRAIYQKRFWNEEMFSDHKRRG